MALFHLSVTQVQRSAGQSAVASAAYLPVSVISRNTAGASGP